MVKVIGCSRTFYWYNNKIGKTFIVDEIAIDGDPRICFKDNKVNHGFSEDGYILQKDCIVFDLPDGWEVVETGCSYQFLDDLKKIRNNGNSIVYTVSESEAGSKVKPDEVVIRKIEKEKSMTPEEEKSMTPEEKMTPQEAIMMLENLAAGDYHFSRVQVEKAYAIAIEALRKQSEPQPDNPRKFVVVKRTLLPEKLMTQETERFSRGLAEEVAKDIHEPMVVLELLGTCNPRTEVRWE